TATHSESPVIKRVGLRATPSNDEAGSVAGGLWTKVYFDGERHWVFRRYKRSIETADSGGKGAPTPRTWVANSRSRPRLSAGCPSDPSCAPLRLSPRREPR